MLLVFIFIRPVFAQGDFAGGQGTAENPYLVKTAEHLDNVRDYLDCHFKQIADIDLSRYRAGTGWSPIHYFTGIYDGNRHTITNLTIDNYEYDNAGLFGLLKEHFIIKNTILINVRINSKGNYIGGLVGSSSGEISNCLVQGEVNGGRMVGGLAGKNNGQISASGAEVDVTGESRYAGIGRFSKVGGFVGVNYEDISRCFARGAVKASGDYVGGFVGKNGGSLESGYINRCYAVGDVSGKTRVGRFVGYNDMLGGVKNSYAVVNVSGRGWSGGFAGADSTRGYAIIDCYYDKNTTGGGGVGKGVRTEEMQQQSTFTNWNFSSIWTLKGEKDYPSLQWEHKFPVNFAVDKKEEISKETATREGIIEGGQTIKSDGSETSTEEIHKKPEESWQVSPARADFGEEVKLSYNLYNDSNRVRSYVIKPVLIRPDGTQMDDMISRLVQLEPWMNKNLTWEFNPGLIGDWDLIFLVWDREVIRSIIREIFKEDTDWKEVGSRLMFASFLESKGPFRGALVVGNDNIRIFKEKLEHFKDIIFVEMKPPSRENWVGRFIDKYSGAEEVYERASKLQQQAQDNWQRAKDYLYQNNLEAAASFLEIALLDNYLAHSIFSDAGDIFIEAAMRGEKTTYAIMRGSQESLKFIALLSWGPEGYKAASRINMAQNYIVSGLTEGWGEASQKLSAQILADLLIEKSGILKAIKVEGMISDEEIYRRLSETLSDSEFVRQLIWEFTASGLAGELAGAGSEQVIDEVLEMTHNKLVY